MTDIPPELQALADAEMRVLKCRDKSNYSPLELERAEFDRDEAAEAYGATQAKECRPPADAKDGSLWWLAKDGDSRLMSWLDAAWRTFNCSDAYTMSGWTIHSECRFGETGVSVTCEEIDQFLKSRGVELLNTTLFHLTEFIEQVRAPKLEISDEEIDAIFEEKYAEAAVSTRTALIFRKGVRAVIAKVGGEK